MKYTNKEYNPVFIKEMEEINEDKPIHIHSYDDLFEEDDWIHFDSLEELDEYLDEENTFDIFEYLKQDEWNHILIRDYLENHDLLFDDVDVFDNDLIMIKGYTDYPSRISEVLNISKECIYIDYMGLLIINLFQEKYLRGIL